VVKIMNEKACTRERNYLIFRLKELGGTECWLEQLPAARAGLKDAPPPLLALDFEGIDSLHSRGINYLTSLLKELEPKKIELCLLRMNAGPRKVLDVSRVDRRVRIFLNEAAFLEYAAGREPKPDLETPETAALRAQIAEVKAKIAAQEKELERFKQRSSGQGLNTIREAEENMMRDIIPLLDDLERALQHKEQPVDALKAGLALIKNKYQTLLAKYGN
jgi:hypothetical protein